jgi:hypothetical protein
VSIRREHYQLQCPSAANDKLSAVHSRHYSEKPQVFGQRYDDEVFAIRPYRYSAR